MNEKNHGSFRYSYTLSGVIFVIIGLHTDPFCIDGCIDEKRVTVYKTID